MSGNVIIYKSRLLHRSYVRPSSSDKGGHFFDFLRFKYLTFNISISFEQFNELHKSRIR